MAQYTAIIQTSRLYAKWRQFFVIEAPTLKVLLAEVTKRTPNKIFHQGYVWKGKVRQGKAPAYYLRPAVPYKCSYTETEAGIQYKCSESPPDIIHRKSRGKFDEENAEIMLREFSEAYAFHVVNGPLGELEDLFGQAIKILKCNGEGESTPEDPEGYRTLAEG